MLAVHREVTLDGLGDPGYGRTPALKLVVVVVAIGPAVAHGIAARCGRRRAGRVLAQLSLAASSVVVLLATALVG